MKKLNVACWCRGSRRSADGVMFAVIQNYLAHLNDDITDRPFIVTGDVAQRRMTRQPGCGNVQRLVKARLRHMIDARDIGKSHPGVHGADIARQNALVILLKLLIGLDGTHSREKHARQGNAQKKADEQKFDACFQARLLPTTAYIGQQRALPASSPGCGWGAATFTKVYSSEKHLSSAHY